MSELLSKGLDLFASGDLRGAAKVWLQAKVDDPSNSQLDAYLRHIQTLDPAVFAEVEQELAGGGGEPAQAEEVASAGAEVPDATDVTQVTEVTATDAADVAHANEVADVPDATEVTEAAQPVDAADAAMAAMGFASPVEDVAPPPHAESAPEQSPPVEQEPDPQGLGQDPEQEGPVLRGEAISDFEMLPRRLPPAQNSKHVPSPQNFDASSPDPFEAPPSPPQPETPSEPVADEMMIPNLPPRKEAEAAVGEVSTAAPVAPQLSMPPPGPDLSSPMLPGTGDASLDGPVPPPPDIESIRVPRDPSSASPEPASVQEPLGDALVPGVAESEALPSSDVATQAESEPPSVVASSPELAPFLTAPPPAAVSGDILPAPPSPDTQAAEDTLIAHAPAPVFEMAPPPAEEPLETDAALSEDTVITQAPPPAAAPEETMPSLIEETVITQAPPPAAAPEETMVSSVEDTVITQAPPPAAGPEETMVSSVEDTVITQAPPPAAGPEETMVSPVEDTMITQAPPPAAGPEETMVSPVEDTVITQAPPPAAIPVQESAPPPAAAPILESAPPPAALPVQETAPPPAAVPVQESAPPPAAVPIQESAPPPAATPAQDAEVYDIPAVGAFSSPAGDALGSVSVPEGFLPPESDTGPWGAAPQDAPTQDVVTTGPGLALVEEAGQEPAAGTQESLDQVAPNKLSELELRLKELDELDDFTGALEVSRLILGIEPEHQRALEVQERSEQMLQKMYESKIGQRESVPKVLLSPEELIWLDLDHRSGFVLAQIDGVSSFEDIVELTGMDPLESYRILAKLVQDGVIGAG